MIALNFSGMVSVNPNSIKFLTLNLIRSLRLVNFLMRNGHPSSQSLLLRRIITPSSSNLGLLIMFNPLLIVKFVIRKNNDFYLCAHAGMIGTTRPTHYHVLYDEVGFSADELQELVHSLSYVSFSLTVLMCAVAPICYAHLAATQLGQWMKFEDTSETSSSHGGGGSNAGPAPVPQLPRLEEKVSSSMFFC
nr:protein argonaute 4-like [Ipomoea batatas]